MFELCVECDNFNKVETTYEQMGIQLDQTFEMHSGIVITSVYLKLTVLTLNFGAQNDYVEMGCVFECYLSRDAMLRNKSNVQQYLLPNNVAFRISRENFNIVDLVPWCYVQYKKFLADNNYGPIRDLLEDGQQPYESSVPRVEF